MSLQLASASRLKPDIRLAQAVSQFEAELSGTQKTEFRTYRSQSRGCAPSIEDVMRLAAEVDRRSLHRSNRHRCLGPRMINFLQSVQQFTALGDIIVGGSQNIVACGVWALVRFSLLSIVQRSTYLEKISELLMDIGRSAPRYQAMAMLYPRSKALQSHLSEYFIVVVQFCHRLVKITHKSALGLLAAGMTDSDLNSHQSELEVWASAIKEQVNLLTAKKIGDEVEDNSRFRILASKSIEAKSYQQHTKKRLRILDFCSEYDYQTSWKQSRKVGNATIFNLSDEYQAWKQQTNFGTLLYGGKLGAGKTVLLANIVDDLLSFSKTTHTIVAYFFCRHDILESLKCKTIIGSLARQLLRQVSDFAKVDELYDMITSIDNSPTVLRLLRHALPADFRAYLILDGLDDLKPDQKREFFINLGQLQNNFAICICISVRLGPMSICEFSDESLMNVTSCLIPDVNPDIESFIDSELEHRVESRSLILGDASLILEIREVLSQGSKGMFLWVSLQIETLCMMETDEHIRQALKHLPKDLPETYSRILDCSGRTERMYQGRILRLVAVAHRPLTAEELREPLGVSPGNSFWNLAEVPNDMQKTLRCCGCLLILDEEELTVRVMHPSVKQFLLQDFRHPALESRRASAYDRLRDVDHRSVGFDSHRTQKLALRLLKTGRQADHDIGQTLAGSSNHFRIRPTIEFHFLRYAKSYRLPHILESNIENQVILNLLLVLFLRGTIDPNTQDADGRTPLSSAVSKGNIPMVRVLSQVDSVKINAMHQSSGPEPTLVWAAREGHSSIVNLLLQREDIDALATDSKGWTALHWAAWNGSDAIIAALLEHRDSDGVFDRRGTSVNTTRAVLKRRERVAEGFLNSDAFDFKDINSKSSIETFLSVAARCGRLNVVKLLHPMDGIDVNSRNSNTETPLMRAAKWGYLPIVEELLKAKDVDVNASDSFGRTALTWAARRGHQEITELLLRSMRIDPNLIDEDGQTALIGAIQRGHLAVVETLLKAEEVHINAGDLCDRTPLILAAKSGKLDIVKMLLRSWTIDINLKDCEGLTALAWAVIAGELDIVKCLIEDGDARCDIADCKGRTPFALAQEYKHSKVAEVLWFRKRH